MTGAAAQRALRLFAYPGAILDRAFLPRDCEVVRTAEDPDVVTLATGSVGPAAMQWRIGRARARFGWRPLLVAHYGEIHADPGANAADLDAVFSFAPAEGRNARHERHWRFPPLRGQIAAREALDPDGLWARPKTRFCAFVYSNSSVGDPGVREAFARALMRHGPVDCPGRALNNAFPLPSGERPRALRKVEYLSSYRFTIAFEHLSADHYLTEKLLHALIAGSIPVYWGCPQVAEYVNPACFVNCHDFPTFEAAIAEVLAIESDPDRQEAMRRAPAVLPGSRILAAHADLDARWAALVERALARRGLALSAAERRRRWTGLAARGVAAALSPRRPFPPRRPWLAMLRRARGALGRSAAHARDALLAGAAQARAEAAHIRGPRTGARWLAWLGRRLRWTLWRGAHGGRDPVPSGAGAGSGGTPAARLSGARAFAGSEAATCGFDPRFCNPVGWTANVESRVLALGPLAMLPPGARARGEARLEDSDALMHAHHVEDVAAFHAGPPERAAALVRLAACGVPVRLLDAGPALRGLLGAELHDALAAGIPLGDLDAREAVSVRLRRLAHRDFAERPAGWPSVSVLLATRRPECVRRAVANVARQDYPRLELVLALHGNGFGDLAALGDPSPPMRVVRVGAERPLGAVLEAAAASAQGDLLAKMDDDDAYDAHHILDLVLARAYTGAELVGKGPENVYLAGLDLTVRRGRWRAERFAGDVAGGGLLVGACGLARAGGWRPLARGVDQALVADVLKSGGSAYRTHGSGFLLVRHGRGHAWRAAERRFLADADSVHRGWRPDLAGISEDPWFAG